VEDHIQEAEQAAARLESAPPQDILRWAVERHRPRIALACSFGMQSVACIDMLHRMNLLDDVEVFYLDTGVLFPETHQTRLRIQERYGFRAVRVAADHSWEQQQARFGGDLYERGKEGVDQCCELRKTLPQRDYLVGKAAWITGMRRSHAKTRASLPVVQWDAVNGMAKINPMATMDDATVWGYIKMNDVPYNPLYDQGYPSIGCNTPVCTRPVKPGDDPRSGRWAGLGKVECGIHLDGNQIKSLDASQL
jgi:phosphoadenosine phosphosulfate reductase